MRPRYITADSPWWRGCRAREGGQAMMAAMEGRSTYGRLLELEARDEAAGPKRGVCGEARTAATGGSLDRGKELRESRTSSVQDLSRSRPWKSRIWGPSLGKKTPPPKKNWRWRAGGQGVVTCWWSVGSGWQVVPWIRRAVCGRHKYLVALFVPYFPGRYNEWQTLIRRGCYSYSANRCWRLPSCCSPARK